MVANKNDRKQLLPKKTFGTGPMPEGYGYADRGVRRGEEVYIWETHLMYGRGEPKWVKVTARPEREYYSEAGYIPSQSGFSFIDPVTNKLSYLTALRHKQKWVEDATYPHGGRHVRIGLHDPNPFVCIKTDGDKPIEVDEKGLAYYPISIEEGGSDE